MIYNYCRPGSCSLVNTATVKYVSFDDRGITVKNQENWTSGLQGSCMNHHTVNLPTTGIISSDIGKLSTDGSKQCKKYIY